MKTAGQSNEKLIEKQDIIYLSVLTFAGLAIGTYLIATTAVISKDGVGYIERAQQLSIDPIAVIRQHPPGFPFMIMVTHKLAGLFSQSNSVYTWIYSAQFITLLCRLLAVAGLYLIGRLFVGSRDSFRAMLILLVLPYPAEMASEVIREWPHLLFFSWGALTLILAVNNNSRSFFLIVGVIAGIGHIVRPECVQIAIYAIVWLLIRFCSPASDFGRRKCLTAALLLAGGLMTVVVPYVSMKGEFLPDKLQNLGFQAKVTEACEAGGLNVKKYYPGVVFAVNRVFEGAVKLFERIGQNLMYYFTLPVFVGFYLRFRKAGGSEFIERILIFGIISLYLLMLMLLYHDYGYISRRHCLPVVVFSIFYLPKGIEAVSAFMCKIMKQNNTPQKNLLTFIFFCIGIFVCLPKLFAVRDGKAGYAATANWIKENTPKEAIIAVSDRRISFYAERKGIEINKPGDRLKGNYIAEITGRDGKNGEAFFWVDQGRKKKKVVLYHNLDIQ